MRVVTALVDHRQQPLQDVGYCQLPADGPLEIKSVIQKASVIATEVGIHLTAQMDSRLRGNDSFITGSIF
jgi:hypothetical protein